jgi:hypothetical protein
LKANLSLRPRLCRRARLVHRAKLNINSQQAEELC